MGTTRATTRTTTTTWYWLLEHAAKVAAKNVVICKLLYFTTYNAWFEMKLWPTLIFCYISQYKVVQTPKTCSQIIFLISRHPFAPLFQHSRESISPFMSVHICWSTSPCWDFLNQKNIKGSPFGNEQKFCLRFWWNSKHVILMS